MAVAIEGAKLELERTYRSELAHSTKLAALGRMASTVAHEIKNPLAGIIGALRVLESDATVPPPAQRIIGKVLAQVDRLSKTVVAALDFARPVPPSVTQVDLVELLDRVISFVEPQATEQKIQVRKHFAVRTVRARVDPDSDEAGLPQSPPQRHRGDASRRGAPGLDPPGAARAD